MVPENIAGFTGTLVQRHYKPGQKYIQLVFETTEGMRLSLTRNLRLVRSLTLGHNYNVRGEEYVIGSKYYIHNPITTPAPLPESSSLNIRYFAIVTVTILTLISFGGLLIIRNHGNHNRTEPKPLATHQTKPLTPTTTSQGSVLGTNTTTTQPPPTPTASPLTKTPKPQIGSGVVKPVTAQTQVIPTNISSSVTPEPVPETPQPTVTPVSVPITEPVPDPVPNPTTPPSDPGTGNPPLVTP